jgi:glycosyltransferase involved in cell wall biosynthesis
LKIAAKVDAADIDYFEAKIKPLLNGNGVEFIGEIADAEKSKFLGEASALLFPINWPEPFGLVMIEAMACGTPVLAFRHGAAPEVIDDGVTGFVVDDIESAIATIPRLLSLDRRRIREAFENRFTVERMAINYGALYARAYTSHGHIPKVHSEEMVASAMGNAVN